MRFGQKNHYDEIKSTGFALIEIILVCLIVGFLALLIGNLPQSIKLTTSSNHQSLANQIASKQIEDLRTKTFANLANGTTTILDPRLSSLPDVTATITLSDCPVSVCSNNEKIKRVDIVISWLDSSKTNTVNLNTFIGEGGLQ